jgi:dimethylamine monooxygenase subunit A
MFDFDYAVNTPFRMQPGLRRLPAGSKQLQPVKPGDRHLREKLAVLSAHASQALLARPGFDARPALQALCEHAAAEHPQAFTLDEGWACARWLGWSVRGDSVRDDGGAAPELGRVLHATPPEWRLAALLSLAFAEDFAIIDGNDATIPWLAVALPSHWAPEEKVGRHFAQVHAPVADNQVLVAAAEHLAKLVTGTDRWERFVWSITRHPRLSAHPQRLDRAPWPAAATPDELAAQAWFRTERQTFIPLPQQHQAVFTIHVELTPLTEAFASREQAARIRAALATMSGAVLAYRGLGPVRERLLAWLDAR